MSDITDTDKEDIKPELRQKFWKLIFVFMIIFLGLIAVISRLFYIQVIEREKYKKQARMQHEAKVQLRAERGSIYDRNGKLMASTVRSFSFAADPTMITKEADRIAICKALDSNLKIPYDKSYSKLINAKGSFVWLARGIVPGDAIKFDSIKIKGFLKIREPKRTYLYGSVASQVIGFTDIDNKGISGIELGLDSVLKGINGYMIMNRDAAGHLRPSIDLPLIPAIEGKSVSLTLDMDLQTIAENELMIGIQKSGAEAGTLIAMNPNTGEILAMASYPSSNPNNLNELTSSGMRCRSITDFYEPGSTFKLITAAVALEENITQREQIYDAYNGLLKFSDYKITDAHPMGKITFNEAFTQSSNIVFSTVAGNIPANKFYKYIRDFGFGVTTGIDLPGEVAGRIKKQEDFDVVARKFMGFGYGIAVTPLQELNAYCTVANGGTLIKPYILKSIFDDKGNSIYQGKTEKIRKVISKKTTEQLISMLCNVVNHGTGIPTKIEGLKIAGKTGTTQQIYEGSYSKKNYTASFAGFFPAEDPKVAMIVILDKPVGDVYGGTTAAPIFRNIARAWAYSSKEIMIAENNQNSEPILRKPLIIPDFIGMFAGDAEKLCSKIGLKIDQTYPVEDIIVSQSLKSGTKDEGGLIISFQVGDLNTVKGDNSKLSKINVIGLSLRRAIAILHSAGVNTKITGSGRVKSQVWSKDKQGKPVCSLKAE